MHTCPLDTFEKYLIDIVNFNVLFTRMIYCAIYT